MIPRVRFIDLLQAQFSLAFTTGLPNTQPAMKTRQHLLHTSLVATMLLPILLGAGCAWSIGGSRGETSVEPTRGQELIDLKRAHEQGAISDEEYETLRQQQLDR